MGNQTERLLSGIVKFTVSREELKDILSEKYDVDVESVSFEEVGVSISLPIPQKEDKEEEFGEGGQGDEENKPSKTRQRKQRPYARGEELDYKETS